jgi:hypothetical protein
MKKQIEIYKKLHGKHICNHRGCKTMVLGDFCLEHIEQAIAQQWDEIETSEADSPPRQTGE